MLGLHKYVLCIGVMLICVAGNAQESLRSVEIGFGANAAKSDLNGDYSKWRSSFQLGILLNDQKRLCGELNLSIGSVVSQASPFSTTDLQGNKVFPTPFVKTSFAGFSYNLHVNIINMRRLKVYASPGIGLLRFTPKDELDNPLLDQNDTRELDESFVNSSISFPMQLGSYYQFDNGLGIGYKMTWFNPGTDYLDNMSQWADPTDKDNLLFHKFVLMIPLPQKEKITPVNEVIEEGNSEQQP